MKRVPIDRLFLGVVVLMPPHESTCVGEGSFNGLSQRAQHNAIIECDWPGLSWNLENWVVCLSISGVEVSMCQRIHMDICLFPPSKIFRLVSPDMLRFPLVGGMVEQISNGH